MNVKGIAKLPLLFINAAGDMVARPSVDRAHLLGACILVVVSTLVIGTSSIYRSGGMSQPSIAQPQQQTGNPAVGQGQSAPLRPAVTTTAPPPPPLTPPGVGTQQAAGNLTQPGPAMARPPIAAVGPAVGTAGTAGASIGAGLQRPVQQGFQPSSIAPPARTAQPTRGAIGINNDDDTIVGR